MLQFWAKSGREGEPARMHSVPHHCLDVAASAAVLLTAFRIPVAVPTSALAALIAFHDIGKFTRPFQAKVPELWPPLLGEFQGKLAGFHDDAGYALLSGALKRRLDPLFVNWPAANSRYALFRAVTGHHGRPPCQFAMPDLPRSVACDICIDAASAFIDEVFAVIDPAPFPKLEVAARNRLAWFLAGLAVAADWLGSGRRWFPLVDAAEHTDLRRYWHDIAQPRAREAAAAAGLIPSRVSPQVGLASIFPGLATARPVQSWAERVALPDGPALFTIEDGTGSGKTEAALVLAHRIIAAGRGDGLFFALPTMATADAMYARLEHAYRRLFASDTCPSLVLAHSHRSVHPGFTASILDGAADRRDNGFTPADQPAGVQCAAWIADDRRKAFLAEIGVGTIDQAIMAVLPTRHAPLRLVGLSQRALIVDEAHAYDAYMSEELRRLVAFQGALGGSAIVLSATLTAQQRNDLNAAFLSGIGRPCEPNNSRAYPLVTVASAAGIVAEPCALAPGLARRVAVERVSDAAGAIKEIAAAARARAAIVWVRNAVDDAIEANEALRAAGVDAMLFHARFAMGNRQDIEREVVARFGCDGKPEQRHGRVLVATQVVEQSLDLDFDLVVTDLAPADLVIQRAGRLWRHQRGERSVPGPRLLLLAPAPIDEPPPAWLGPELRRTGFVYPDHALLWRSARVLLQTGCIETPDGVRALVEAAYDRDACNAVPPGLSRVANRAEGAELAAAGIALQNLLEINHPYERDAGLWEPDVRTPTRLGNERVVFRLARLDDGTVVPWYPHAEPRRAWALSEVSLRANRLKGAPEDAAVNTAKRDWPVWDRDIPVLVLRPDGVDQWQALALDPGEKLQSVTYDRSRGLIFSGEAA
jgi:CRISPR-associated endonuclease/helicase Cas3